MPNLGPTEIIIIAVVVMVLFGAKKMPDAARSMGRSLRIFKAETKDFRSDEPSTGDTGGTGDTSRRQETEPTEPQPNTLTATPQVLPAAAHRPAVNGRVVTAPTQRSS